MVGGEEVFKGGRGCSRGISKIGFQTAYMCSCL